MKTILVTGIGGLTPRSVASIIRENHPDYRLIGVDVNKKAVGFFMKGLLDEYFVCPRCTDPNYFPFLEKLVADKHIDYACPVFMGSKILSVSLKDKSIMADLLKGTEFIPKTIKVTQDNPCYEEVEKEIGFPCWIRATEGTGGLGSLKLEDLSSYKSWLFINSSIPEFTVSEFLTGRHLANEMLYYNGEYVKGAALECAEYVMANTAPSHVTGNTAFGRFLNEDRINEFCDRCIKYLEKKLNVPAHGILSFDLKEDKDGNLKVTEVNIRHMAYVGVMSHVGFDLVEDTIKIMEDGNADRVERAPYYHYEKPYIFLRDVDVEPIILPSEDVFPQ